MTPTDPAASTARFGRRQILTSAFGLVAATSLSGQARASDASKAIRIVVPFAAGGATDALGRLMARHLEKPLGQSVIVENRPGASGAIGATAVARADPDGSTLLMGGVGTNIVLEHTMPSLAYRPARDFASVVYLCNVDYVLAVAAGSPYRSVQDLLADAKARPNAVRYMSTGPQGPMHVAIEYLSKLAGVRMIHAPYQGEAPAIPDLIEQRLDVATMTLATTRPLVATGKLRILATINADRLALAPDVPTVAEAGFPGYAIPIWNGLFAPKGTPSAAVERIGNAAVAELQGPALREAVQKLGMTITAQGPAEYDRFLTAERLRWKQMIDQSGVL